MLDEISPNSFFTQLHVWLTGSGILSNGRGGLLVCCLCCLLLPGPGPGGCEMGCTLGVGLLCCIWCCCVLCFLLSWLPNLTSLPSWCPWCWCLGRFGVRKLSCDLKKHGSQKIEYCTVLCIYNTGQQKFAHLMGLTT